LEQGVLKILFALSLLALSLLSGPRLALAGFTPMDGKITRVLNGDTIQFQFKKHSFRLQLYGIDAPEEGQPQALAAKKYLENLALLKPAHVQVLSKDLYKRYIAKVTLSPQSDLSQEMVKAGYAWWYRKYAPKETALKEFETQAKKQKLGIWNEASPTPPWEFREHTR